MFIGETEITKEMMPSYIAGKDYPLRLYQARQERLNAKLQPTGQPVQTAPVGNMDSQPNQWQGNNR